MIRSNRKTCSLRSLCWGRRDALILSFAVFVALAPPSRGHAGDAAVDPSGHWEGSIHAPSQDVTVAVDLAPRSPEIDAALAGRWTASLDVGGNALAIVLTMSNRADGTSVGGWAAADGSTTPVAIAQHERSVTLTSTVTSSAYTGTLSSDGTEITGTFTEGALQQPMTFRHAAGAR